jgi:hypothetical protein
MKIAIGIVIGIGIGIGRTRKKFDSDSDPDTDAERTEECCTATSRLTCKDFAPSKRWYRIEQPAHLQT